NETRQNFFPARTFGQKHGKRLVHFFVIPHDRIQIEVVRVAFLLHLFQHLYLVFVFRGGPFLGALLKLIRLMPKLRVLHAGWLAAEDEPTLGTVSVNAYDIRRISKDAIKRLRTGWS